MDGTGSNHDVEAPTPMLLSLPAEIRNLIYEFTVIADLETFIDKATKPGLLNTSKQLRQEYINIFFANPALQIEVYTGPPTGWQKVQDPESKCAVFEASTLTSSVNFWSLGSTRRYCQREYSNFQGNIENGIMTIKMFRSTGIHRWQWSRSPLSSEERKQLVQNAYSWLTPDQIYALSRSSGRCVANQLLRSQQSLFAPDHQC